MEESKELQDGIAHFFKPGQLGLWYACKSFSTFQFQTPPPSSSTVKNKCRQIIKEYLESDSSQYRLNISQEVIDVLKENLKEKEVGFDILDDVWRDVEVMMEKRPFPRFHDDIGFGVLRSWDALSNRLGTKKIGKFLFMTFFEKCPEVMSLFTMGNMAKHGEMVAGLIDLATNSLQDINVFIPEMMNLGRRHRNYGFKPEYIEFFREALIETVRNGVEKTDFEFDEQVEESWRVIFALMEALMIRAFVQMEAETWVAQQKNEYYDSDSDISTNISSKHQNSMSNTPKSRFRAARALSSSNYGGDQCSSSSSQGKKSRKDKCIVM